MRVAICGSPSLALQVQAGLRNNGAECKFFIKGFASETREDILEVNFSQIRFFDCRKMIQRGELDGVIIADRSPYSTFTKDAVLFFKFYRIPQVFVMDFIWHNPIYTLDADKAFLPYLETSIIDSCNLSCKGCVNFAALFGKNDIYPLETFRRDVRQISEHCDLVTFHIFGGEPLLLKNLDEYIRIARQYLPKTHISVVTNGLLIPSLPQKILDAIKETDCIFEISAYTPTLRIIDKIKIVLISNKIRFILTPRDKFVTFLTLHDGNDPEKARVGCLSDICRFLRDGKIYKCQTEALKHRFEEHFEVKEFPKPVGIDLFAPNFPALIPMLDGNVEQCRWCSDKPRQIDWQTVNKPKFEDWLADPDEKNIL